MFFGHCVTLDPGCSSLNLKEAPFARRGEAPSSGENVTGRGRHRRPSKTAKAISTVTATASGVAVAGVIAATSHSSGTLPPTPSVHTVSFVTNDAAPKVLVQQSPAHLVAADSYTVKSGDYLSKIAEANCGNPADWTGIYEANQKTIGPDPDVIEPGQVLVLDCTTATVVIAETPQQHWDHINHLNHLANEQAPAAAPVQEESSTTPAPQSDAHVSTGGGSYESCVISRESGGNPGAVNPTSGAGGLYQFLPSTWESLGYSGLPQDAPVSEQEQAFEKLYAESGSSPWVSDGC